MFDLPGIIIFDAWLDTVFFQFSCSTGRVRKSRNKIMYDPSGTDNGGYPEFLEFYNKGSEPIDMSFFQVSYGSTILDNAIVRLLAEGTVIQPGGYLVLAGRKDLFEDNYFGPDRTFYRMRYGAPNPDDIVDLGWSDGSKLANGGTTIFIVHPNETVIYSGTANVAGTPYFSLTYSLDQGSGWPRKVDGSAWNGPSFELNERWTQATGRSRFPLMELQEGAIL